MSEALAVAQQPQSQALALTSFEDFQRMGELFAKSKMFADVTDAAQAAVKIMAGAELGLTPFVAMSSLHVVKGKITLSADLLAKKLKQSPKYDYKVIEHDATKCVIEFFENGESVGKSSLTMAEAKAAKMDCDWNKEKGEWKEKATWKSYPKNMLFARTLSNGVRFFCPDVTAATVYVDGEVSEAEPAIDIPSAKITDPKDAPGYEDRPAVIAAIKKAAKECGFKSTKPFYAEASSIGVNLAGDELQIALESLTTENRAKLLNHLQSKALDSAQAKPETPAEPDVHQGEVM